MMDTPRTDSVFPRELLEKGFSIHGHSWGWGDLYNMTILARALERELAAERAKVARLREALADYVAAASGAPKSCGHAHDCVCPGDKARAALKDTDG